MSSTNTSHTITAALMVKNEEAMLEAALASVAWADEIVVLDSGSTDNTLEIAKRFTDKIYNRDDWQGFGEQRNRLHNLCSSDWIVMIDADERVTPALSEQLQNLRNLPCDRAYKVKWPTHVFGKTLKYGGWSSYKLCVYPRVLGQWDPAVQVHEQLRLSDGVKTDKLEGALLHYSYKDMEHYLVKSARYGAVFAEQREARGKSASLLQASLHALGLFIKMYLIRGGFLDGRHGLLMALLSGHSCFIKYADLWTRTKALK